MWCRSTTRWDDLEKCKSVKILGVLFLEGEPPQVLPKQESKIFFKHLKIFALLHFSKTLQRALDPPLVETTLKSVKVQKFWGLWERFLTTEVEVVGWRVPPKKRPPKPLHFYTFQTRFSVPRIHHSLKAARNKIDRTLLDVMRIRHT